MARTLYSRVFALLPLVLAIVFVPSVSRAQSEEVKSAREKVSETANKLTKLKEGGTGAMGEELSLKRTALEGILDLSIAETESLHGRLSAFEGKESELVVLQEALVEKLSAYHAHLLAEKERLLGIEDVLGMKLFAQALNEWRMNVYNPEVKKAIDVHVVMQAQEALKVADARFAKLSIYVKRAKSLSGKTGEAELLLNQAARSIKKARLAYGTSREVLLTYIPREENSAAAELEIKEPIVVEQPTVSDLVTEARVNIKDAYVSFLKLAKLFAGN